MATQTPVVTVIAGKAPRANTWDIVKPSADDSRAAVQAARDSSGAAGASNAAPPPMPSSMGPGPQESGMGGYSWMHIAMAAGAAYLAYRWWTGRRSAPLATR